VFVAASIADLPRSVADKRGVPPNVEPSYLSSLLDRQPSCLIRVGTDGVLLAVSEAALSLLGGTDLNAVLGTTLTERIVPEQRELWIAFSARVWSEGSGSHECDILGPSGSRRPVMLQGVALPDHPDGTPSILVMLRDVSATRRLEAAVQEHTIVRQAAEALRRDLDLAVVEQQRLAALLAEKDVGEEELRAVQERLRAELDEATADRQQLHALVTQWVAEGTELRALLDRAAADRQLLEKRLAGTVKAYEQLDASRRAREASLQQTLAGNIQLAREFQNVTAALEAAARALLEKSPVDGPEREAIETIRGNALRLASLARQMAIPERSS
jgi:PAS domain-containing protein